MEYAILFVVVLVGGYIASYVGPSIVTMVTPSGQTPSTLWVSVISAAIITAVVVVAGMSHGVGKHLEKAV